METFDTLKNIIVDQLGVAESEVTKDAHFQEDLGADSLDIGLVVDRALGEPPVVAKEE